MIVAITGASGFVGQSLVQGLRAEGLHVRPLSRTSSIQTNRSPDLGPLADWSKCLDGASIVIHSAGKVHSFHPSSEAEYRDYNNVNVDGVCQLLRHCQKASVKHFIFLSTIKVNGESSSIDSPFTPGSIPNPTGLYAESKYSAELLLQAYARSLNIRFSIIRLPLIYGPNPPANFGLLLKYVSSSTPLPLLSIRNQRSILGIDNLISFISHIITHQSDNFRIFLVSDPLPLSTPQLIQYLGLALGLNSHLFRFPPLLLSLLSKLAFKSHLMSRLSNSLHISLDSDLLGWSPPHSTLSLFQKYYS